jgi:plasmid stabilization system protein ParE
MLKADGYEVRQIHSDRAAEFISPRLERWCRERDILQTWSAGAEPQSNGRAERTVQEIKSRVRRLLHAARVGPEWWPVALRNVNERLRRERMKVNWNGQKFEEIPAFMQEVTVKKRFWRTKELEPGREVVRYLSPTWLHHGHWVLREDGTRMLTRAVFKKGTEPVDDQVWVALEDALTPVDLRRRLRGKVLVRRVEGSQEEDKPQNPDQGAIAKEKHLERIIQEEMTYVVHDEMKVAQQVLDATKALRGFKTTEEEEILQTKIVSPQDVKRNADAWKEAIEAELKSLMETKRALRVVPPEEARQMTQDQGLLAVPAKVVFTIKPDATNPRGKKKCRIVACGNYAPDAEMDCFAAGTDAATLRLALAMASKKAWYGANLDVKTAFLNAPMTRPQRDSEEEEGLSKILLRPPPILVSLGHVTKDQFWEVLKAMYGFRQSPRLWSDYRDDSMRKMKTSKLHLVQMETSQAPG